MIFAFLGRREQPLYAIAPAVFENSFYSIPFPARLVNTFARVGQGLRMNGMDNVSKKSIVVGAAAAFSGEADFRRMIF